MSIMEKYPLSVSPDGDSLSQWDATLQSIITKVNAPDPAPAGEKVSSVDVLDKRYGEDEVGAAAARKFLRDSGILDQLVQYADDDPSNTFHLTNAVREVVMTYLQNECGYFRKQAAPKTVGISEKSVLRSDFNELRRVFNGLAAVYAALNPGVDHPAVIVKNGKPEYHVSGFRGPNTATGEVHGKYARVYALSWVIDGDELSAGTQLSDIVRSLWHGSDRIGKNSKDLAELLDEVAPAWKTTGMADQTFIVNGHDVTISQSGPESD